MAIIKYAIYFAQVYSEEFLREEKNLRLTVKKKSSHFISKILGRLYHYAFRDFLSRIN